MSSITFHLTIEPETEPISFDSGDAKRDRALKTRLEKRLDDGDLWAWCVVVVTARCGELEGFTTLGACSYRDAEQFKKGGYLQSMKADALTELKANADRMRLSLSDFDSAYPALQSQKPDDSIEVEAGI
jgi:hypothetical protein